MAAAIPAMAQQTVWQWDFDNGNLNATIGGALQFGDAATGQAAKFGTTTSFGVPNIGGLEARVIQFPASVAPAGLLMPTPAPNGGGSLVNEYTVIMDVLFTGAAHGKIRPLVQTDDGTATGRTSYFTVGANNGLGAGTGPFQGSLVSNSWHRVAFVADATTRRIRKYVDGVEVGVQSAGTVDGSNALTPAATVVLFGGEGENIASGYANSIQLRNTALSAKQVLALGKASATGIPTTIPPIPSNVEQWIPAGEFANRNTELGAVIDPGSTTIQDSTIGLKLDGTALASPTISRSGGLIRVSKPNPGLFAPGTKHKLELSYTDSLAGAKTLTTEFTAALLFEDFESIVLGPRKDENNANTEPFDKGWTNRPPTGWTIDNSKFPAVVISPDNPDDDGDGFADNDGRTEWAGWSFANKDFWIAADNQTRDQFSLGKGTLAIADPDEWDDLAHAVSLFNSFLKTPPVSLEGIAPGAAFLKFDSSWRPEGVDDANASKFPTGPNGEAINNQTAIITVSYDGKAPVQILKWDSIAGSPTFHPDMQNESVLISLNNPVGAKSMVIEFALVEGANDWWWAIDNVVINAGASPPIIAQQPKTTEVEEGKAASLSATFTGEGLSYQWFKGQGAGKTAVTGGTSGTLSFAAAKISDSGYYTLQIKNISGSAMSIPVRLSVIAGTTGRVALLTEDFEKSPLGPNVDEGVAGDKVWTKTAPEGWSIDDSKVPGVGTDQDGVTEWAGWSFANRLWWSQTAGDQERSKFTKGVGAVAIADSDEWDDVGHAPGNMETILKTKAVSLEGIKAGTVVLKFDSSWRPETPQRASVMVSFDGSAPVSILDYNSDPANADFRPDEMNETISLAIANPAGAKQMAVHFRYFETRNNWWWAIDNLSVLGEKAPVGDPLLADLVAYLPFDGDVKDASGRNNNGTAVGNPGFAAGKVGASALSFTSKKDGSSFNYVSLGTPADLDFGTATSFSVAFWAKLAPGSWTGDPSFLANKDWGSGNNRGWVIATDGDGRVQWNLGGKLDNTNGDRKDFDSPGGVFSDGNWHHIVVSFNRNGTGITYVDGKKFASREATPRTEIPIASPANNLSTPAGQGTSIGQDGTGKYTDGGGVGIDNGLIDEVAIWRRALNETEAAAVFARGQSGVPVTGDPVLRDLVAYLPFDGNTQDASGRGNNGTAVGAPGFVAGKVGSGALSFTSKKDGTSFNYVTLGNPADLNFGSSTSFSVSYWAKLAPGSWTGDPAFLSNKDWGSGNNQGWVIATDGDGRLQWNLGGKLDNSNGDRKDFDSPGGVFSDGNWHHIAVTFDRAGAGIAYVDGKKFASREATPRSEIPIATPANNLSTPAGKSTNIGQDGTGKYTDGGGVGVDNGQIDEVAIWRRVLTAQEVTAVFDRGSRGQSLNGPAPAEAVKFSKVSVSGGNVSLDLTGGKGPFLVQTKVSLSDAQWINLLTTPDSKVALPQLAPTGFYRILEQASASVELYQATLSGAAENPPVTTGASGRALLSLEGDRLIYIVYYTGLSAPATAAHVHGPADPKTNAGVIFALTPVQGFGTSGLLFGSQTLTAEQKGGLAAGVGYINIHTSTNPGGELRGQIVK